MTPKLCPGCKIELAHMPKDNVYYCYNTECELYSREQRFSMPIPTEIENAEEYEEIKLRVDKASAMLEKQWFSDDPRVKNWVRAYDALCALLLDYEIENNLLPL